MKITIEIPDDLALNNILMNRSAEAQDRLDDLVRDAIRKQIIKPGDSVRVASVSGEFEVLAVAGDLFWCRFNGNQPATYHRAVLTKVDPS